MQIFLDILDFPNSTSVNKKIDKKEFTDNFSLNINERKVLSKDIIKITLLNLLNQDTININSYVNEDVDYSEMALLKVEIASKDKIKAINNIIQQIPYILIVVYQYEDEVSICLSPKRVNKSDSSKLVVEEVLYTNWINFISPSSLEQKFLNSLNINNQPFTNFLAFYDSYIDKIVAFNASKYIGSLGVREDTKEILEKIKDLEQTINEIKNKIKKETNFSDKVKLNMELKKQNDDLKSLKEELICKN